MNLADYHAKYDAYELTRRFPSDRMERIVSTLMDAQVDLNPHRGPRTAMAAAGRVNVRKQKTNRHDLAYILTTKEAYE